MVDDRELIEKEAGKVCSAIIRIGARKKVGIGRTPRVPQELMTRCIDVVKDYLSGDASLTDAALELSSTFNVPFDKVENILMKAKKKVGYL